MHVVGIKQIIERALVSYSGVTTSAGGAGGATLVDSTLSIDYDGQTVLITSGSFTGQARDIDGDTSSGTVTPSSNFGGIIVAGTTFLILSGIPAMAEFDDIKGSGWTNENLTTIDANIDALMADLGDMADAATNDNMSDIATTSALAKLRLILNRLSTAAFTANIQGAGRTELDTMLAEMAKYFATGGAVIASTVDPGGSSRATIELILEDLGKILAGGGITTYPAVASPGNGVAIAQVLRAIVNSLTGSDTYTAYTKINNIASTSLDGALQALAGVFAAAGTDVFEPTIQGSARANLELAFFAMASYFVSAAGAFSVKVNNQDLRTNFESILQDFFAVVGCDGTNAFNPSVGGSARTTIEAAFAALSTMLDTIDGIVDTLAIDTDPLVMGRKQVVTTTWDLLRGGGGAGTDVLFTGTTQAVILESLIIRMPLTADITDTDPITSMAIATDDVEPGIIISATDGAVANLTPEAQLAWTGALYIPVGTEIEGTLAGGDADAECLVIVTATYRAVVSGGYLE